MNLRYALWATLLFVVLCLLLGCATPGDVWRDGGHVTLRSSKSVRDAARCIADNAESVAGSVTARDRVLDDGTAEVTVRAHVLFSTNVSAVAKIVPDGSGSLIQLSTAPDLILPSKAREILLKGCG